MTNKPQDDIPKQYNPGNINHGRLRDHRVGDMNELNYLTEKVIGSAIKVHKELGPGLLESAYQECLNYLLIKNGLFVEREKPIPVQFENVKLDCGYRIDLLVEKKLVLELKAVEKFSPVHHAQVLTYLKLGGYKLGLLLNFNVPVMKQGIRRIIN